MSDKQRTLKKPVSITGVGLHTGNPVTLTVKPAPVDFGIKFLRVDLNNGIQVPALVDYVVDTLRGTSIAFEGVRIDTVEHVLAALTGLKIDNALIELNAPETPILDGSAGIYVQELETAGIIEQNATRSYYELSSVISYTDPEKNIEIIAIPDETFRVSVMIDFETQVLATQNAVLNNIEEFCKEIAPCRTFAFLHELEYLLNNNLIKGGDLSNAIVFVSQVVPQERLDRMSALFNKPRLEVRSEGILNNLELKFPNEPARHKLLDVVGDLALLGKPLKAHVIARRPGHFANVQFARRVRQHYRKEQKTEVLHNFDPLKPPLYDINEIKRILPHRFPFLLIDRILEMGNDYVVGLKNVTFNEPFFAGHFPEEPVMPGVLLIEAMAQTGGMFSLANVEDPENYETLFLKIEQVKFRHKVVPGDTVIFHNVLNVPVRRGLISMTGHAYVGQKVVMEARMIAQVTHK
jgi:UDP-3-O-[3-hydroxymyristoyl] N-acetylglucosamine deacetylase/3-hydroxyacyl-[acyl-carrier-protein] dehydratase